MLTRDGSAPTNVLGSSSVLGIWSAASRRKMRMFDDHKNSVVESGPWVQVSRLGNPLFNEVIVPLGDKDRWNAVDPIDDDDFVKYVKKPELAGLLNVLYPGAFTNIAAYTASTDPTKTRQDLQAILLTGIPGAVGIPGFQNFTGPNPADMLRLNVAIHPTTVDPSPFGVVGGDLAGFPNGRRVFDDVVTIELRAIAGLTIPLVDPSYHVDDVVTNPAFSSGITPAADRYQEHFPYLGSPLDGFSHPSP
jgi:hypothetical protein